MISLSVTSDSNCRLTWTFRQYLRDFRSTKCEIQRVSRASYLRSLLIGHCLLTWPTGEIEIHGDT